MADPAPARPPAGIEPRISYVVARLDRALQRRISDALEPHDVTVNQYTVLSVLGRRTGLSNAQLARRAYVTPQAMNEILQSLERKGLVARTASPDHGLIRPAHLTASGERVLTTCETAVDAMEQQMMAGIPAGDRSQFNEWLKECVRSFDAGFPHL